MRLALVLFAALVASASHAQDWTESPDSLAGASGRLYGTLTVPAVEGPMPVALIIAGSGPTDRDGNQGGRGAATLRRLAHALAEAGVATLRTDKRGVGASADAASALTDGTYAGFVEDAADWIDRLQADPRFSTVSVVGHSEGSLFALAAARARRADAVVSLAGGGVPITTTLRRQLSDPVRMPLPALRDEALAVLDGIEEGDPPTEVSPTLAGILPPTMYPLMMEWAAWDPAAEAAAYDGPLLVVQGTTDRQVDVADAETLAAAQPSAQLMVIDGMNHVLVQDSGTLMEQFGGSYFDPERPLDPTLVREVTAFLLSVEPRAVAPVE